MKRMVPLLLALMFCFIVVSAYGDGNDSFNEFVLRIAKANQREMVLKHFSKYTIYFYDITRV